jgi:hypothetical protein
MHGAGHRSGDLLAGNWRRAGATRAEAGCGEAARCEAGPRRSDLESGSPLEQEASLDPTPGSIGAFRAGLKLARAASRQAKGRAALLREAGAIAVLPTASVFRV